MKEAEISQFVSNYMPNTAYIIKKTPAMNEMSTTKSSQQTSDKSFESQSEEFKTLAKHKPAAAAALKSGIKCPDKLSSYIERSFQKCINQTEREFMETILKQICAASKNKSKMFV